MTYVYDGNIRNPKWYKQTNTQRLKVHRSEVEDPTIFLVDYCPGLNSVFGEMKAGQHFISALFGLPGNIVALPPTSQNLFLHILWSHHTVILTKVVNQQGPPHLNLCLFDWDMKGETLQLLSPYGPTGSDALLVAMACAFVALEKACSTQNSSFRHHHLSCKMICNCAHGHICYNP